MALQVKKLAMPYGVEFSDVYFKLNRLSYNDEDGKLYFAGAFYLNKESRESGLQPIESGILCEVIDLPDKTVNLYEYVYNHIKEQAIKISEMSDEEIMRINKEAEYAGIENGSFITGMINVSYKLFKDAIDC